MKRRGWSRIRFNDTEQTLGWCVTSSCLLSVPFPKWLNYRVLLGDLYSAWYGFASRSVNNTFLFQSVIPIQTSNTKPQVHMKLSHTQTHTPLQPGCCCYNYSGKLGCFIFTAYVFHSCLNVGEMFWIAQGGKKNLAKQRFLYFNLEENVVNFKRRK